MNTKVTSYALGLLSLLFSAGGSVAHAGGEVSFQVCPGFSSQITLTKVQFEPLPPSIKRPLTIIASGSSTVPITAGATLVKTYKLGTLLLAKETDDLCSWTATSGLPCPIAAGTNDFRASMEIPANIPTYVSVAVRAVIKNGDGSVLGCWDFVTRFTP